MTRLLPSGWDKVARRLRQAAGKVLTIRSASAPSPSAGSGDPRRRMIWLLFLALTLHIVPACASVTESTRTRGFSQTRSTQAALEESFEPRRYALVIGIDRYQDATFGGLKHAIHDARAIAEVLRDPKRGGFDDVWVLDEPARTTRAAILGELRRARAELRRQDTFLLYFSGHGTAELSREGEARYYLVASDTRANALLGTGVELTALMEYLGELKPQRSVAIFDSCFSGEGKSGLSQQARQELKAAANPWARLSEAVERSNAILMATVPGGVAHEDDRLGHGIFTYSLLEAFKNQQTQADANTDGAITPYEAYDFARQLTAELSRSKQAPEGYFRVTGRGELYVVGQPDPQKARAARIYAYGTRAQKGMKLEVDGRPRGTFPRTLSLEPGPRLLTLKDEQDETVASGRLTLLPDEALQVDTLLERLSVPRWSLTLSGGGLAQVLGPASLLWGRGGQRLDLGLHHRVRGGTLSGLESRFLLGWQPVMEGPWVELSSTPLRQRFELGMELGGGRSWGRVRLSSGAQLRVGWLSSVPGLQPDVVTQDPLLLKSVQGWQFLELGPSLSQRLSLSRGLALLVRQELRLSNAQSLLLTEASGSGAWVESLNLMAGWSLGLEAGF